MRQIGMKICVQCEVVLLKGLGVCKWGVNRGYVEFIGCYILRLQTLTSLNSLSVSLKGMEVEFMV